MKQLALVICYLAMYILLPAQNFTVNLLPDIRKTDPRLVKYQDGYYTVDYEPQYSYRAWSPKLDRIMLNITIKKYGTSFQEAKVVQLPGPDKSYGPLPPALKLIHNKLCLFYTKLAKDNTIVLYVTAIDPVTLETGPPTEVMVIDVDDRDFYQYMMLVNSYSPDFDYKRFSLSSRYGFSKTFIIRQSHNGEYLMVAWAAKLNDKLNLALLDKNMKRIQSKICQLPGKALLSINSACVDNSGNGYFTLAYPQKNDIVHQLFINRKDGSEENKIIDLPSGYIAGIKAVADPKHDRVWFCGPYIENTDNLAGVYQVGLDTKTSVWGNVVKTPFDSALVEIFDKENWAKTKMKKYGLYPDIMWEANIFSDGILHLTGEFRDQIDGQRASFDRTGSILNASFRGNKAVFTRIPKIRVSAASTFGDSYRIFGYQNELIVFYNDFPSSLKRSVEEVPERSDVYTSSALLAGIIRADGSLTREIVIDKSKEDFLSGLSNISEFEPGQFFVPLSRIRKLGGITDDIQWTMVKYK